MLDACKKHDILMITPPFVCSKGPARISSQASRADSHVRRFIGVRLVEKCGSNYHLKVLK